MRRRSRITRHHEEGPRILLSPMIDLTFLLLVTFIVGTMYMSDVHTVPIALPKVTHAEQAKKSVFTVTLKKDGTLYLDDKKVSREELIKEAGNLASHDSSISVVLRSDKDSRYEDVMKLMDDLKSAGITHFGLAADMENK